MKIAFFATLMTESPWGGSEELWYRAARLALERGHQVAVVSYGWPEPPRQLRELQGLGARLLPLGRFGELVSRPVASLADSLEDRAADHLARLAAWKPDVVCASQGGTYDMVAHRVFTRFLDEHDVPYIVISQFNSEENPLGCESERQAAIGYLSRAGRVAFVAERNLHSAERHLGVGLPNAVVVRNPVNLPDVQPVPYPAGDVAAMASVARLSARHKGQDVLFEALAGDHWRDRRWVLRLYGAGPDRPYLERLARHFGIGDRVEFRGHVRDIRSIWAENHLLVMPSRSEGTPLAMVEAMLCARPAVVTDVGGNTEWVDEPETGFVAEAPLPRCLGAALGRAWDARHRWEAIGRRAHEVALSQIDPHPGETILAMLESVVSGQWPPATGQWKSRPPLHLLDRGHQ